MKGALFEFSIVSVSSQGRIHQSRHHRVRVRGPYLESIVCHYSGLTTEVKSMTKMYLRDRVTTWKLGPIW